MSPITSACSLVLVAALLGSCSDSDPGSAGGDGGTLGFPTGDMAFADAQPAPDDLGATADVTAPPDVAATPDVATTPDVTPPMEDTAVTADGAEPPTDTASVDDSWGDTSEDTQADSKPSPEDAQDESDQGSLADGWTEVDSGAGDDACAWTEVDTGPGDAGSGWTEVDTGSGEDGCAWGEEDGSDDDACPVDLQQIFIITDANWLLRFEPATLSVVPLGMVSCPAGGATPFSMAVDKEGYAWVLYSNGSLWKVNTGDASCQSTNFASGQQGFSMFGMGFTADGPTTNTETLFISGGSMSMFMGETGYLGSIALPAMMVSSIAQFPVGPGSPELTGTRFGELWGFFAMSNPSHVSRIHKQTSALEKTWPLPNNLQGPQAWAFAHWGGDFYLFFKSQSGLASGAFHLDGLTGVTTEVVPNLGHTITGAGVSICAPTQ
jgi:hypothetical protein